MRLHMRARPRGATFLHTHTIICGGHIDRVVQLWMLQGGPGLSSVALENSMISVFQLAHGTYDVCTLDYRGTHTRAHT